MAAVMTGMYIERRGNASYIQMKSLMKRYELSKNTMLELRKGIEEEIERGTYPEESIRASGKLVFINELVLMHYIGNRDLLADANARKYCKPFSTRDYASLMGWEDVPTRIE